MQVRTKTVDRQHRWLQANGTEVLGSDEHEINDSAYLHHPSVRLETTTPVCSSWQDSSAAPHDGLADW